MMDAGPNAIVGAAIQADVNLVTLVVNAEVIRLHPVGARMGYLLRGIPQWDEFMSGTDIDPVRDTDWVLISGPSLVNTSRDVILIHYSAPDAAIDKAIDVVSKKYDRGGRFDEATRAFDGLAGADANADLWAARSIRESKGCRSAVARFDKVAQRAAGSPPGWDALLEGGACYRAIGDLGNARVRLNALLAVDSHKDKARAELDRINQLQQAQGSTGPAQAAGRPSPRKAAAPATTAPPPSSAAVDSAF